MDEGGKILGIATRRGAYYPTDGMAFAFTKIKEAVEEAIAQAGITREQIGTAIAGITGIDWQGDKEKVTNELKKYLKFLICMPIMMQLLLYTVWRKACRGKRSGTQRIERRRESSHQSGDPAGESKERECGCNTGRL